MSTESKRAKQRPKNEEKPITKREADAANHKEAKSLLLKDEFETTQQQKRIDKKDKEKQHNDILELVQEHIATGEYCEAIQAAMRVSQFFIQMRSLFL